MGDPLPIVGCICREYVSTYILYPRGEEENVWTFLARGKSGLFEGENLTDIIHAYQYFKISSLSI